MTDHTGSSPFWDYPDPTPVYDITTSDASMSGYQYARSFEDLQYIRLIHPIIEYKDWDKSFSESQDVLSALVDEAEEEINAGLSEEIGWDEL